MVRGRSATAFEGTESARVRRRERATGLYTEDLRRIQSHDAAVILAEKVRGPSPSSTIVTNGVARAIAERIWRPTNWSSRARQRPRGGTTSARATERGLGRLSGLQVIDP